MERLKLNSNEMHDLAGAFDSVNAKLKTLEIFVSRRFDELSMEVNATSQLVNMAEDGIRQHFAEILEILGAINFHGEGLSPVNTGVELDAVVKLTEEAANRILDAADSIIDHLKIDDDWHDEDVRKAAISKINRDIQDIMTACTFQDLTGQRIRKTIENLQLVETRLTSTLQKLGIAVPEKSGASALASGISQDEINTMFERRKK